LLLDATDYRKELMEEAEERFMPSPGIWGGDQLYRFAETTISRKLRQEGLDNPVFIAWHRKKGDDRFPKPIASAPINWVLEALITEFVYLSTFSLVAKGPVCRVFIENNFLELSLESAYSHPVDEEIAASVNDRELGLLHLLNSGHEGKRFEAKTDVSPVGCNLSVKFDMYEAPVLKT
jgi:hypothetical protein